jgi:hypothetical protein
MDRWLNVDSNTKTQSVVLRAGSRYRITRRSTPRISSSLNAAATAK